MQRRVALVHDCASLDTRRQHVAAALLPESLVYQLAVVAGLLLLPHAQSTSQITASQDSIAVVSCAAITEDDAPQTRDECFTVARMPSDTVRPRKKVVVVEYSDWYGRRLTVHRWASYLTLPLFAGNYVTGTKLLEQGNRAPSWAIQAHGPLAAGVTALFGVNTFTGGWNLLAARGDPSGRAWRTTHALLMLTADAGFAAAGILSDQAERSDQRRRLHRAVALGSIGTSVVSYLMMLPPLRRD